MKFELNGVISVNKIRIKVALFALLCSDGGHVFLLIHFISIQGECIFGIFVPLLSAPIDVNLRSIMRCHGSISISISMYAFPYFVFIFPLYIHSDLCNNFATVAMHST